MSTNPKDAIGLTKPQLHLVPPALILHTSQAMADGATKYGPYNWRENAVRLTVYIAAAQRHLLALLDGEDRARDSGHLHAAHVAACMAIILDAYETRNLIDDRAQGGLAGDIIEALTKKAPAALVLADDLDELDADEPIPFTVIEPEPMAKMSIRALDMRDAGSPYREVRLPQRRSTAPYGLVEADDSIDAEKTVIDPEGRRT